MEGLYVRIYNAFSVILRNRRAFFGFCVLVLYLLTATIGPLIVPPDMSQDFLARFQLPSLEHILGTDFAGRDILRQMIHGSTDVMIIV